MYPPPAPRELPKGALKNIYLTEITCIVGMVFLLTGSIFLAVGGIMASVSTSEELEPAFYFVFLGIGALELMTGVSLVGWCITKNGPRIRVLREGAATQGKITRITHNTNIRINGRSPIVVHYTFNVLGHPYNGQQSTLNQEAAYQVGDDIAIVYDQDKPDINVAWHMIQ